ncbi:lysophospholipase L1-like esterase [Murinocardiopsis flavida]|uniref:Lysophospholipase L1-like esterase n=1 Tax=Murinocardiopsis flavida TaxID=645275 RepID=A0A2P8DIV4_9ACTN|nr:GDSL-type esterase/lipase family protein [Murinocardiopsis flavida]PSK97155.1 lysophospholipase L1-like esterase [Murinocardiopsis flavida]
MTSDSEPEQVRTRPRFQPSTLGLVGVAFAAMAVTLLLLQTFMGTFRSAGSPPEPTPDPSIIATPPEGTARIMVAGDSLAQGSSGDYTWRYRLWKHLTDNDADVDFVGPADTLLDVNAFDYGDTSYAEPGFDRDHYAAWGASAADIAKGIGEETAQHDPDYLLLMAGTNDLVTGSEPEEALEHVRDAVSTARVARGNVQIVLGELTPMWGTGRDKALNNDVAEFNRGLPRLAAQLTAENSPVVVAHTAADYAPADDNWDTTHPNARGELRIAAAFADALDGFLDFGAPYPRPLPKADVGPRDPPVVEAAAQPGGVRLSWRPVPGATRYKVLQRRIDPDPDKRVVLPTEVDGHSEKRRSVDVDSLFSGADYEFVVQPYKGDDAGVRSEPVRVTADSTEPGPPEWVRITADRSTLVWAEAPRATHFAVWRRALRCEGDECEPRDGEGPDGGAGWQRMEVVNGDRRWPIGADDRGYEYVVVAHRDFVEGEASKPLEVAPE